MEIGSSRVGWSPRPHLTSPSLTLLLTCPPTPPPSPVPQRGRPACSCCRPGPRSREPTARPPGLTPTASRPGSCRRLGPSGPWRRRRPGGRPRHAKRKSWSCSPAPGIASPERETLAAGPRGGPFPSPTRYEVARRARCSWTSLLRQSHCPIC